VLAGTHPCNGSIEISEEIYSVSVYVIGWVGGLV